MSFFNFFFCWEKMSFSSIFAVVRAKAADIWFLPSLQNLFGRALLFSRLLFLLWIVFRNIKYLLLFSLFVSSNFFYQKTEDLIKLSVNQQCLLFNSVQNIVSLAISIFAVFAHPLEGHLLIIIVIVVVVGNW